MRTESIIADAICCSTLDASLGSVHSNHGDGRQSVVQFSTYDGNRYIAKLVSETDTSRLESEADGLKSLRSLGHLLVPTSFPVVRVQGYAVLIMAYLESARAASDSDWSRFGVELAQHHLDSRWDRYGWDADNYIGATPQQNTWCDDWVEFNAVHRLGYQLKRAQDAGAISRAEGSRVSSIIDRLDRYIPHRPHPALLHGDLWSGNVLATMIQDQTRIGVIDPAVSVGDGWADIAMLRLFGSVPRSVEDAYAEYITDMEQVPERIRVYQLYHMLNHVNLFGSSYVGSVMRIVSSLGA